MSEITQTGDQSRWDIGDDAKVDWIARPITPAKSDKLELPSGRGIAVDAIVTWTPRDDGGLNVTTLDGREGIYHAGDATAIVAALREVKFK